MLNIRQNVLKVTSPCTIAVRLPRGTMVKVDL